MEMEIVDKLPTGKRGHHTPDTLALLDAMEKLEDGKYIQIKDLTATVAESLRHFARKENFLFIRRKGNEGLFDVYFWKKKK